MTQIETIWINRNLRNIEGQPSNQTITEMLNDGWELIHWHPLIETEEGSGTFPGHTTLYDVFLLKKTTV